MSSEHSPPAERPDRTAGLGVHQSDKVAPGRASRGAGTDTGAVEIPETLLLQLRRYWQLFRPFEWLFPGRDPTTALGVTSAQKCFTASKCNAGVDKVGGIHSLRHAYATHQLAAGMPIPQLQHQMGHQDIRTTLRYVHWGESRPFVQWTKAARRTTRQEVWAGTTLQGRITSRPCSLVQSHPPWWAVHRTSLVHWTKEVRFTPNGSADNWA